MLKNVKIKTERDVEGQLLEPLLRELGFAESDWQRQQHIKVGRGEKAIPDYVVLPTFGRDRKLSGGAWVWEAKLSVPTKKDLHRDFAQARSYALLVGAKGVGLCSKEGIWTALKADDYQVEKAQYWPAARWREVDVLNDLRDIAGMRSIKHSS